MSFFKKAFTLSEVLITLGIIGMVAALTMPAVIANYQKQETVSRLQKVYSVLSQAVKRAELSEGEIKYWNFSLLPENFYKTYIRPYITVSQEFINSDPPFDISYKCLNGRICNTYGSYSNKSVPKIILNDGSMIIFDFLGNIYEVILTDINGYKKPNTWGKDMFAFSIQAEGGLRPYGLGAAIPGGSFGDKMDRETIINSSNARACKKGKDGVWCAALIMMDGWQINKDYPW